MPSPIGHALGGAITAALAARLGDQRGQAGVPIAALWTPRHWVLFAALGMAPDLDLIVGAHSAHTHSLGAAAFVMVLSGAVAYWLNPRAPRATILATALTCAAAYASHLLLDGLGTDTAPPIGIMAFWPFSDDYSKLPVALFPPVPRNPLARRFWTAMPVAVLTEVVLLGPLLWMVTSRTAGGRTKHAR